MADINPITLVGKQQVETPIDQAVDNALCYINARAGKIVHQDKPLAQLEAVCAVDLVRNFGDYLHHILFYRTPQDKASFIDTLVTESKKERIGVLLELRAEKGTFEKKLDKYQKKVFLLKQNKRESILPPELDEQKLNSIKSKIGLSKNFTWYQNHPVISTLLALQATEEYQRELFQGKLPYLLVDTNPDNNKTESNLYRDDLICNVGVLTECIYQAAVPVLFLRTIQEGKTFMGLGSNNPYKDFSSHSFTIPDNEIRGIFP